MTISRIVDADCHILEPPDIWSNWLPERYQDKAPKLVKDPQGGDAWRTAVGGDADPIGLVATPGMPFDQFRWFGVTYEEARPGCYNGEARIADMDHRRRAGRDPLPAAAHDEPLPRRRRRRLRPGRRRGVQQLPVRGVLRSRPRSSGRVGADAVVGHRYGGRRAPQGEGARREGRDHLELAVRGRDGQRGRRPVLGRGRRRGPPRIRPHQHHQPAATVRGAQGRRGVRQPARTT